jgi:hypothetical protein
MSSHEWQCIPLTLTVILFTAMGLFIYKTADFQYFFNHFLLAAFIAGGHGILKTGIKVILHQCVVRGSKQAHYGKVLLHNIDAVFPAFHH